MVGKSDVPAGALDLVLTRTLDAPLSLVFETWTKPEHLLVWWGPRGFTTLSCDVNLRVGGDWRVRSRAPDGTETNEFGVFREIVPPSRIAFTHAWEKAGNPGRETLVTVTFEEEAGRTKLTFRQSAFENVATRDGHQEGWSSAFELLAEHLAEASREAEGRKIRELITAWTKALSAKDLDALVSCYTPEVLQYDLAPPLLHRGADLLRRETGAWFSSFKGLIGYEIRDLSIAAGSDVAFSTSLNRMHGRRTGGEVTDLWLRATFGFRKLGGDWRIAHEHISVPFHMDGSDKAAVDLKP